jgi:LPXTG-site transpeptidase (sortase) family protein
MIRRFLAFVLVLVGFGVLVASALALFWSDDLQRMYTPALPKIEQSEAARGDDRVQDDRDQKVTLGKPIGLLEIPRLGLTSVVIEGDDVAALLFGVGHLADTPLPWHGGNSVLAAHRDTFFRPLAGIRRNDLIKFSTADAEFEYVVKETMIVESTDVEVLDPTDTATLTLITCYPFDYIGPAPNRFIVRAERRSRAPIEPEA